MTNIDGKRAKYLPILLLALIILLLSAYMVYWGTQKEGYYIDEMYSMMNIRGGGLARPYFYDDFWNTWHIASDLESTIGVTSENAFTYTGQPKSLYWNLLHIAYSLRPDEFSVWPSVVLNILTLAIIQIIMYKLSQFFIKNKYLALLPGFIWGISSAAINLVMFIRVYLFMTLFCLLLLYFVLLAIKNGFTKWRILLVIPIAATAYFGAYLHQYFLVFAFSMSVCVGLYLLITRQFKSLLILVGAIGIPVLLGYGAIQQLLGFFRNAGIIGDSIPVAGNSRGVQAAERLVFGNANFTDRLIQQFDFVSEFSFANMNTYFLLGIFITFAIIMLISKNWKSTESLNTGANANTTIVNVSAKDKPLSRCKGFYTKTKTIPLLLIGGICLFFFLIIAWIVPANRFRYISCITPFTIILFVSLTVNALKAIGFKRTFAIFAIITIPFSVMLLSNIEDIFIYRNDSVVSKMLDPYRHLPVIRICGHPTTSPYVYWWYFEFEDKIIFTHGDDESMELISETTYENGVLFIAGDYGGDPGIESILEVTGLSNYTLLPTNTESYRPIVYYLAP